ncbi:hypothetical protein QWY81_16205 [Polaribacter undariae]|uniref:Uncharacterized protein n=1 Tax=Polaribacter sejongensis TaxID=985043 RepID=A0AAJ1QZJ6_9FLAO|nr:hypothetical protein [Polaribacter undariae]MDN3621010.1 hypothetical protein [Polaribacter undariae]UWD31142.1 hypothetical protein NQP51_13480 [Polaribacter undariae]
MHKKLEADLMSLAHSILQLKNKEDVFALKEKSKEIYEKLSLLAFVEEYINTTPNLEVTKEELIENVEKGIALKEEQEVVSVDIESVKEDIEEETVTLYEIEEEEVTLPVEDQIEEELIEEELVEELVIEEAEEDAEEEIEEQIEEEIEEEVKEEVKVVVEEIIEQPFDEIEDIIFAEPEPEPETVEVKEEVKIEESKTLSLEEELQDTISVDQMATLFDIPVAAPKSLNDKFSANIQIGLNDRIAFVKNLFDGSQEDFNRVVSQLNTYGTEKEALKFINKMVKPDYDWSTQQELEARFIEIVERKFA